MAQSRCHHQNLFCRKQVRTVTNTEPRLRDAVARMHEPWGGVHCLDFANTLEPRGGPPPLTLPPDYHLRDELATYDDLVAWAVHKETLGPAVATRLLGDSDDDPDGAHDTLKRAHALRDAIYRAFWQIADGESPSNEDLAIVMGEYADATAHARLVATDNNIEWDWIENGENETSLARPLWAVARSAVDLLITGDRQRIKVCPGPGHPPLPCGWLFYDTTKNGSRRWCSMTDCGAATKARLQTERRRKKRVLSRS
jgi:predicted RNA-binding Zn ribbon-like protein